MKDFSEKEFERYSKEYGVYVWKGVELALILDPFFGKDVYGNPCYYAAAIDRQGNEWGVKWEVTYRCDWENPTIAWRVPAN